MKTCVVDECANPIKYSGPGWCAKHYQRMRNFGMLDLPPRQVDRAALMWAKLDIGDCWRFTGCHDSGGYGQFYSGVRVVKAHRWVWGHLVGPIPAGLELDHLCKQRDCCNPDHLEPVTPRVNTLRSASPIARSARKTHCPQGHPYAGENLVVREGPKGRARICRTCSREHRRRSDARRRGAS